MIKNRAGQVAGAQMIDATTGLAFLGAVTAYVTGDAAGQALGSVGGGVATHEGNGYFTYRPSKAETNYNLIAVTFIGASAVPETAQYLPAGFFKNVAGQPIGVQMIDVATGDAFTGAVTVYVTDDAGTQALGSVGAGLCTHQGNGYHTYAPSQDEANADLIGLTFVGAGAVLKTVSIETSAEPTAFNGVGTTGADFVRAALREIKILDPIHPGHPEQINDGLVAAMDMLGSWALSGLTISGTSISGYDLVADQQSYEIGEGAEDFDQAYPTEIESWSVVPDTTAADPLELPMGPPVNATEWQHLRLKTQTGRPSRMHFDRLWEDGIGHCLFHPIPDSDTIGVRIYAKVPVLVRLVAETTYTLRYGATRAIKLQLALELADRYDQTPSANLMKRATEAFAWFKMHNIVPKEAKMRPEFAIGQGQGRRTFDIYRGSS